MIQVLSEFCVQPKRENEAAVFEYCHKSLRLSIQHSKAKNLSNLYIITTFSYQDSSSKASLCKFIIPKIHRCQAKYIDLWNQNLTLNAFKTLVSPKHVRQIYFEDNNGASGSRFTLSFKKNPSHEYLSNLKKQIDVTKNFWLPNRGKPFVEIILPKFIKKVHFKFD
uniref:Uncharacterized protein n=1 Tax=Panagrolaimus sp. ES5 TaxID=591445 RepID=A0AC34GNQ0_9BILA